jgi:hypothetical protein
MNTGKITKTLEIWHCTDPRFPAKTTRPVNNKTLDTLRGIVDEQGVIHNGIQVQPVGVIKKNKKEYIFSWGNGRLQRIRDFYEEGFHTGDVDVLILEGVDPNDWATLSLIENNSRSANALGDWHLICELRKRNPMITAQDVSRMSGMSVGTFKKLDSKYSRVPQFANNAMLRGEISESTAVAIGSLQPDTQKEMKELLKAQGYLSLNDVKEKKRFIQEVVYADMMPGLIPQAQPRQFYDRADLEAVLAILEQPQNSYQALELLRSLLSQTE